MPKYHCTLCDKEFLEGWPTVDAEAEAEKLWGAKNVSTDSRFVVVCDTCYQKIKPDDFPELHKEALKKLKKPEV